MRLKYIMISSILVIAISVFNTGEFKDKNKLYSKAKNKYEIMSDEDKFLLLVNKENSLTSNYIPDDLTKVNVPFIDTSIDEEKQMVKEAAVAAQDLFETAKQEGINLVGTSAYRSFKSQKETYAYNIRIRGKEEAAKYVAKPGKSEHQSGLVIDVTNEERYFVKHTKEAQWIENNAYRFGFILRYLEGKEGITGYNYEPWHIRYVGKDVAKKIYNEGITLEEYLKNNE